MSVAAWGYGTGATTDDAHPFTLTIQGIDVIGAVPIESISSNQSVSGNATLSFSIYDAAGTMALPEGWADVVFSEHTGGQVTTGAFQDELTQDDTFDEGDAVELSPPNYLFGGLVMGMTVRLDAEPARWIDVRCVDYGVLLDVTPLPVDVSFPDSAIYYPDDICQAIAAAAPLGGITALPVTPVGVGGATFPNATGGIDSGSSGLYAVGPITCDARRSVRRAIEDAMGTVAPYSLAVSPLRELTLVVDGYALREAPATISTLTDPSGDEHQLDIDYRGAEATVYVNDTAVDVALGNPDDSGYHWGTINGYTVGTDSINVGINYVADPAAARLVWASGYIAGKSGVAVGEVTVTSTDTFRIHSSFLVYVPQLGINNWYAITSVRTQFLGGLTRRSEIKYGGELGTVARFNRTRFARAGVTT